MTEPTENALTAGPDPDEKQVAIGDEDTAGENTTADQPGLLPSWLRILVGIVVLAVLVLLAYPNLRDRLALPDLLGRPAEETVVLEPSSDPARFAAAGALYEAGRFADAWEALRAVAVYAAQVKAMPEIAEAEQAVEAAPASKEAHFRLGTVWARADLLLVAEFAFRQAIALDSQYVDAYVNLGVVYYQQGRLADALAQYDAALAITPEDADIHYNKGVVYVQQALQTEVPAEELLDKGVAEFQRALALNPNLPQAHFSLGVVHNLRGQTQEALAMFERFQELDDGSDPQATEMARTYIEQLRR
jgi:tetratricopeptide (TPR) repeat protein